MQQSMENKECKMFLGGVPHHVQDAHITSYFANFGQVVDVKMRYGRDGVCLGYGFVEMASKQIVDRILSSGPHFLLGQKIDVKPFIRITRDELVQHKSCLFSGREEDELKVFVGGLDPITTNESLKQYFSQFGQVNDGNIRIDAATGRPRGFAILTFSDESSVNAAVSMDKHLVDGKVVEVKRVDKNAHRQQQKNTVGEHTNNLFIGGLSSQTTRESLKEFYSKFGQVVECTVATDRNTGKRRGFGFVRFSDVASVQRCMNGRPHSVDGKQVETKRVLPLEDPKNMFTVNKVFVGGLKGCHDEASLRSYFSLFGNVTEIKLIPKADGSEGHRGYTFVSFDDYDSVDQVILQRFHVINGMPVDCHKGLNKDEMAKLHLQIERDRLLRDARAAVAHNPSTSPTAPFFTTQGPGKFVPCDETNYTMRDLTTKPIPTDRGKPALIHARGEAFRQLLMSTECSNAGIQTLTNENLLDTAVLLSLTPAEFDNLSLSVGDKKRIEIALRSLNPPQV